MAKIFIAGSKELVHERSIIREELSKVENLLDFDVRALTFEDFKTSLKGDVRLIIIPSSEMKLMLLCLYLIRRREV